MNTEPAIPTDRPSPDMVRMRQGAAEAAACLRSLAHEGRLQILCCLAEGEHDVSALALRLGLRQAAVSQQLARLRAEERVEVRRAGQRMIYSLADRRLAALLALLHALYCSEEDA